MLPLGAKITKRRVVHQIGTAHAQVPCKFTCPGVRRERGTSKQGRRRCWRIRRSLHCPPPKRTSQARRRRRRRGEAAGHNFWTFSKAAAPPRGGRATGCRWLWTASAAGANPTPACALASPTRLDYFGRNRGVLPMMFRSFRDSLNEEGITV